MGHANFEVGGRHKHLYLGRTSVRSGSTTVRLDKALVNFYGLSILAMPLTEAVGRKPAIRNASI